MTRSLALAASLLGACGSEGSAPADAASDADLDPGLPCDVAAVLAEVCAHCHASPTSADAPMPLLSRLDLRGPSSVDGQTLGERSVARMRGATAPMPPRSEPPASAADIAVLDAWVRAGMPAGTCAPLPAKPIATTCASGTFWTGGETPDPDMNPGLSCLGCHLEHGGSRAYFFSGTVFGDFHAASLCTSPPPPGARIEILDVDGNVTATLLPTAAGNFFSTSLTADVPLPYRARLVANGATREMATPQTSGDCNACHSEQGTRRTADEPLAPGRIVWPRPRA